MARIEVKVPRQKPDLCGPGALSIALSHFGVAKSEEELAGLASAIEAPGSVRHGGTEHEGMVAAGKALGFQVYTKEEASFADLEYFIEKEQLPVIVGWFDTDDDHYSVAIELPPGEVVLADSSSLGPERRFSRELFSKIWFDFVGEGNHRVSWHWLMALSPQGTRYEIDGGEYH
jgi:predicted double-glycine peptidase